MANTEMLAPDDERPVEFAIRDINVGDLRAALLKGYDDFKEMPTHAVFLIGIYPIVGLIFAMATLGGNFLQLLFPLAAGFPLLAPVAAIGLYELSRRREEGLKPSWKHAFEVLRSHAIVSIIGLTLILGAIFLAWLVTAQAIYVATLGGEIDVMPKSLTEFFRQVFMTPAGWAMVIFGNLVGLIFATIVLMISVVSFPLLLDKDVPLPIAIQTSVKACLTNPITMAIWGVLVALTLLLASLPFFVGLAVALPVLGHATWHLYRKVVVTD